jgi:cytochrome c-type protein NapB
MKSIFQIIMFAPFFLLIAISASSEDRNEIEGGQTIATLRNGPIDREATPPTMSRIENSSVKRKRAYPMQPPTIPHKIDGYQVDLNVNRCLACHSRKLSEDSQATMVSVTHYMDRQGNFLADVSPRRYFCEQCHVTQSEAPALLVNDFVDIDQLIGIKKPAGN